MRADRSWDDDDASWDDDDPSWDDDGRKPTPELVDNVRLVSDGEFVRKPGKASGLTLEDEDAVDEFLQNEGYGLHGSAVRARVRQLRREFGPDPILRPMRNVVLDGTRYDWDVIMAHRGGGEPEVATAFDMDSDVAHAPSVEPVMPTEANGAGSSSPSVAASASPATSPTDEPASSPAEEPSTETVASPAPTASKGSALYM